MKLPSPSKKSLVCFSSLTFSSLLVLIGLAGLSGCASLERGVPQEVTILSFPTEASVYINGDAMGITPMQLKLPRKVNHEIRLEKRGYNSAVKYFAPVPNAKAENFIRFGLSRDLGYYVDLEPGTMKAQLRSDLVPSSTGADPFERMAQQALLADARLEAGEITALEHKFIIEQIIEFFEKQF
ncbi:MAG: PEGA domain-containing protein [Puniceicoccaceae bacterium]|nr:MAG: PEGA domain-containing protein [Puniceicoccaceae bacterium]